MRMNAYRRLRDMILMRLEMRFGAPAGPTVYGVEVSNGFAVAATV